MELTDLWKRRIRTILNAAEEGETDHREISNLAAHIEADYHGRFLVELLQNAEDQAKAAGLDSSRVCIVRTRELVAVSNEGAPFNERGVKAVTSAGISPKDANNSIGNKGIGFKAVFQVSNGPEIYSSESAKTSFMAPGGPRFKLDLHPFQDNCLQSIVQQVIMERGSRIREVHSEDAPNTDSISAALEELQTAAPFKFPLPLSQSDLDARLVAAGLPPGVADSAQTLVVLPLKDEQATQKVVDTALEEICAKAGTILLFLSSVDRVEIVDVCRNQNIEIVRERSSNQVVLSQCHADFCSVRTHVTRDEDGILAEESADFWTISRVMGRGSRSDSAAEERQLLVDATRELPGDNWNQFDSAFVQVAIPKPKMDDNLLLSSEANGHFFIGLPTRDRTGSCASLSAPFHGTISRTGLDLTDQPLNQLLFREAIDLFWGGIERLKTDEQLEVRRSVSLLFSLGPGALAREIEQKVPVNQAEVVLSVDGRTFIRACDLLLPPPPNGKGAFDILEMGPAELEARGFKLADLLLLNQARSVLVDLAGSESALEAPDETYLTRNFERPSLLEIIARTNRQSGHLFWQEFFTWAMDGFDTENLEDQNILPIAGGGLASPQSKVFLSPLVKAEGETLEDDEQVAGEIPKEIRESLRFLDEVAIPARDPERPNIRTELARQLAPDAQNGLVRRPRSYDLINEALAPRLQAAVESSEERVLALSLLLQAAKWIDTTGESNIGRVRKHELRVPVSAETDDWAWGSPTGVYFGEGWLCDSREEMLAKAYDTSAEQRLVPWSEFQESFEDPDVDRNAWVAVMEAVGVHSSPRILRADRRRSAPLRCVRSYTLDPVEGVECPIPKANPYWWDYLSSISDRKTATCSNQRYDVKDLCWIEGLEDPEGRAAVFEMILRTADRFSNHRHTALARRDGDTDQTIVPTLWVQAIRAGQWEVIPTNRGPSRPEVVWLLSADEMNREYALHDLINFVPLRYSMAASILHAVGVWRFDNAPIDRLVRELHSVADKITNAKADETRPLLSLSRELYGRLNDRCEDQSLSDADAPLSSLLGRPVPLLMGRSLVAADLGEADILYLNDDQSRSRLIEGFSSSLSIPLASRAASKALTTHLSGLLGEERIRRTSQTPIETGFVSDADRPIQPLLEVFEQNFVEDDVVGDLLALYCFGRPGVRSVSPTGDEFRRTWELLQQTAVSYGNFREGISHRAAFDQFATNQPTLQLSEGASSNDLIDACWPIFGSGCRDLIAVYARLLFVGELGEFFSDRDVGPSERDQISAVIGRKDEYLLERLKPLLLALWTRGVSEGEGVAEFDAKWTASKRDEEGVRDWIVVSKLDQLLASAGTSDGEQGVLELLDIADVSLEEWQRARELLGQVRYEFASTADQYERIKYKLIGMLKVQAARDASADLVSLQHLLAELGGLSCPEEARHWVLDLEGVVSCAAKQFNTALSRRVEIAGVAEMLASLDRWSQAVPKDAMKLEEAEIPGRDLTEYLDRSEAMRTANAREMVSAILNVAVELASKEGGLDAEAILAQSRVVALSSGWWANRYSILLPLRDELRRVAPRVASRLTDVRAFRDPCGEFDLRSRLPEISSDTTPVASDQEKPKEAVPGLAGSSNEVDVDLGKGSAGAVGEALRAAAISPVDFRSLAQMERSPVPDGGRKTKTTSDTARGGRVTDPKVNERNGLLGEAFVYEVLKKQLRDFDASNWLSSSRKLYGLEAEGDDGLGCDFQYRDVDGGLTGMDSAPLCLIEVKSTSGDGGEPFPISAGEWRLAEQCHLGSGDRIYMIMRVIRVRDHPSIADIIIDPIRLWHDGLLGLDRKDLWVRLG